MYTPKFYYIDKEPEITKSMYTPKFCYIGKDHEITVRELKIVVTHVYVKFLLY